MTCDLELFFRLRPHCLPGVLRESAIAAGRAVHPNRIRAIDAMPSHLFLIAAQADHALRILAAEFAHQLDAAGDIGAAIDQVSDKDQLVGGLVARQQIEQAVKLSTTAVKVAYYKSFHKQVMECAGRLTTKRDCPRWGARAPRRRRFR